MSLFPMVRAIEIVLREILKFLHITEVRMIYWPMKLYLNVMQRCKREEEDIIDYVFYLCVLLLRYCDGSYYEDIYDNDDHDYW